MPLVSALQHLYRGDRCDRCYPLCFTVHHGLEWSQGFFGSCNQWNPEYSSCSACGWRQTIRSDLHCRDSTKQTRMWVSPVISVPYPSNFYFNTSLALFADTTYGPDDWSGFHHNHWTLRFYEFFRLPITYEQAASGTLPGFMVYITSKKYAELAAWDFAKEHPEVKVTSVNRMSCMHSIQAAHWTVVYQRRSSTVQLFTLSHPWNH